jgi:hypothetical protein
VQIGFARVGGQLDVVEQHTKDGGVDGDDDSLAGIGAADA